MISLDTAVKTAAYIALFEFIPTIWTLGRAVVVWSDCYDLYYCSEPIIDLNLFLFANIAIISVIIIFGLALTLAAIAQDGLDAFKDKENDNE